MRSRPQFHVAMRKESIVSFGTSSKAYEFPLWFSHYNLEGTVTNFEKDMFRKESLTYKQTFKRSVISHLGAEFEVCQ